MNIEIKKQYDFVDYEKSIEVMKTRVNEIITESKEELIWFLNHDHIYTQGTSASKNEILKKNKIKIVKTNRGGKTTYHGPGQRIIYFIINLNKRKKDIRQFISIIESSLMEFLNMYNIDFDTGVISPAPGPDGTIPTDKDGNPASIKPGVNFPLGLYIVLLVLKYNQSGKPKPNIKFKFKSGSAGEILKKMERLG